MCSHEPSLHLFVVPLVMVSLLFPRVNNLHTHDSVKPYVRSKGRKFEKARGRRRSNGFKVIHFSVTPKVQLHLYSLPPTIQVGLCCNLRVPFLSSPTFFRILTYAGLSIDKAPDGRERNGWALSFILLSGQLGLGPRTEELVGTFLVLA